MGWRQGTKRQQGKDYNTRAYCTIRDLKQRDLSRASGQRTSHSQVIIGVLTLRHWQPTASSWMKTQSLKGTCTDQNRINRQRSVPEKEKRQKMRLVCKKTGSHPDSAVKSQ